MMMMILVFVGLDWGKPLKKPQSEELVSLLRYEPFTSWMKIRHVTIWTNMTSATLYKGPHKSIQDKYTSKYGHLILTIYPEQWFAFIFVKEDLCHGFLNRGKVEIWLSNNKRCLSEINRAALFTEDVVPYILLNIPIHQISLETENALHISKYPSNVAGLQTVKICWDCLKRFLWPQSRHFFASTIMWLE